MVKILVGITKEQEKWLKVSARTLGISVSEMFRRIVDKERELNKEQKK